MPQRRCLHLHSLFVMLLITLILVGCRAVRPTVAVFLSPTTEHTAIPDATATATQTHTPHATSTPTRQPTSTPLPTHMPVLTPRLSVLAGTPMPIPQEPITPENVDLIEQLAIWGKGLVFQVAFSPDGEILAVATTTGIWLYDAHALGLVRFIYTGHPVHELSFSADSTMLFAEVGETAILWWDVYSGELLDRLQVHEDHVGEWLSQRAVGFSLHDRKLVAVSDGSTLWLWDLDRRERLHTLEGHESQITSLAFSPNQTLLVSGSLDESIRIWDVETGMLVKLLDTPDVKMISLAFSPNGAVLASGTGRVPESTTGQVWLWDVASGSRLDVLEGHIAGVESLAFAPLPLGRLAQGTILASGGRAGTVLLWEIETGMLLHTFERDYSTLVEGLAFSPDGAVLASSTSSYGVVRLSDPVTGELVGTIGGYARHTASSFLSDGILVNADGGVDLWDWRTEKKRQILEPYTDHIGSLSVSADGTLIAIAGSEFGGVWDVTTGRCLREIPAGARGVHISPDGSKVAINYGHNYVPVEDTQTGELLYGIQNPDPVGGIAFAPDSSTLVSTSDFTVRLWDAETGGRRHEIALPGLCYGSPAFSPDGTMVAAGVWRETGGEVWLWNPETGDFMRSLRGYSGLGASFVFSPSSEILVAGVRDDDTYLWDAYTERLLRLLPVRSVNSVLFSPDEKLLILNARDGTVRLWGVPPKD